MTTLSPFRIMDLEEFSPEGYAIPHSVWVICLENSSQWEAMVSRGSLQLLFCLACTRLEGHWGRNLCVILGLRTPVLFKWMTDTLGSLPSGRVAVAPLLIALEDLMSRWETALPADGRIWRIEHLPGRFHGLTHYRPLYGSQVAACSWWQGQALLNGDPPWVLRHARYISQYELGVYTRTYTAKGRSRHINYLGECRFIATRSRIASIVQSLEAIHGRGACAGLAMIDSLVDVTSWSGEPFALVECPRGGLVRVIEQINLTSLPIGCIAVILTVTGDRQVPFDPSEVGGFYPTSIGLRWSARELRSKSSRLPAVNT
jgi:hypothetical protein